MKRMIMQILSAEVPNEKYLNSIFLMFRSLVAFAMIRTHGWKKIADFQGTVAHIPDPFGIGGELSAIIAVFANVGCGLLIALGLFTRPAALFVLSVTLSGLFIVHWGDPWSVKDVPLMYSISFITILLIGPGRYSIDYRIARKQ